MNSSDPKPVHPSRPPMAPPYVDEDVELTLVEQGLREAEAETRGAVADAYEEAARLSDDPDEALDDIDFSDEEEDLRGPELAAIREVYIPEDDEDDEPFPE